VRLLAPTRVDRLVLTVALALVVCFGVVSAVTVLDPGVAAQTESGDTIDTVFSSPITVLVTGVVLDVVDAGTFPGETVGAADSSWVGGAFAVTLVPFLLFVSYLLRILTVAKRTLAIGPLVRRESPR
jgi:hypothetical protein